LKIAKKVKSRVPLCGVGKNREEEAVQHAQEVKIGGRKERSQKRPLVKDLLVTKERGFLMNTYEVFSSREGAEM